MTTGQAVIWELRELAFDFGGARGGGLLCPVRLWELLLEYMDSLYVLPAAAPVLPL